MASENNDDAGASGFVGEWGGAVLVLIVLVVIASTGIVVVDIPNPHVARGYVRFVRVDDVLHVVRAIAIVRHDA